MFLRWHDSFVRAVHETVSRYMSSPCCHLHLTGSTLVSMVHDLTKRIVAYARKCNPVARNARAYDISLQQKIEDFRRRMCLASLDPFPRPLIGFLSETAR